MEKELEAGKTYTMECQGEYGKPKSIIGEEV
jgi:hypothetical protein